jgi:predicted outer membrane repeat protein
MSITNTTFSGNSVNGTGGLGGAIYGDTTTLTLTGDTFSNNTAAYGSGGAIYDETGTSLVISNSRFTGNSAGSSGAIYDSGPLTITMSTFANNSASDGPGGGLYSAGNSSAVANTTFSGNSASGVTGNGGGIYNTNSLVVTNGTFSGNSAAASGGAVYNAGSTLILRNTIVNASTSGGNCGGTITNGSHNIDSGATCGWDSLAGSKSNTNPMLGALTGSPAYFPLTSGSPAVDAGDDSFCSVWPVSNQSQNSVTRPQGAHCDIGSYEKLITNRTLQFQSIGAVDGWILESSENSNVGKTLSSAAAFNLGDNAQKKQYRSVLSFSTKDLPDDAIITKVTLKFKKQGIVGGGNPVNIFKGFIVDVEKGFFGSAAGLQKSDFQFKADKSYGPFKPTLQNGWYTINLTPAMDYINKEARYGGVTQIRLRFKLDDNNNNIANYLKLYSGNAPAASRPQLVIQYYLP